ncbi:hypothetical protein QJQ45_029456 [Haematococcus lacustris]|nr:hypothetical protein QJQ45_029456 [Haematococcus lacustris]
MDTPARPVLSRPGDLGSASALEGAQGRHHDPRPTLPADRPGCAWQATLQALYSSKHMQHPARDAALMPGWSATQGRDGQVVTSRASSQPQGVRPTREPVALSDGLLEASSGEDDSCSAAALASSRQKSTQANKAQQLIRLLGKERWAFIRQLILFQHVTFVRQLHELHKLIRVQRLLAAELVSGTPLQPSTPLQCASNTALPRSLALPCASPDSSRDPAKRAPKGAAAGPEGGAAGVLTWGREGGPGGGPPGGPTAELQQGAHHLGPAGAALAAPALSLALTSGSCTVGAVAASLRAAGMLPAGTQGPTPTGLPTRTPNQQSRQQVPMQAGIAQTGLWAQPLPTPALQPAAAGAPAAGAAAAAAAAGAAGAGAAAAAAAGAAAAAAAAGAAGAVAWPEHMAPRGSEAGSGSTSGMHGQLFEQLGLTPSMLQAIWIHAQLQQLQQLQQQQQQPTSTSGELVRAWSAAPAPPTPIPSLASVPTPTIHSLPGPGPGLPLSLLAMRPGNHC